jgi:hypothetical protein
MRRQRREPRQALAIVLMSVVDHHASGQVSQDGLAHFVRTAEGRQHRAPGSAQVMQSGVRHGHAWPDPFGTRAAVGHHSEGRLAAHGTCLLAPRTFCLARFPLVRSQITARVAQSAQTLPLGHRRETRHRRPVAQGHVPHAAIGRRLVSVDPGACGCPRHQTQAWRLVKSKMLAVLQGASRTGVDGHLAGTMHRLAALRGGGASIPEARDVAPRAKRVLRQGASGAMRGDAW